MDKLDVLVDEIADMVIEQMQFEEEDPQPEPDPAPVDQDNKTDSKSEADEYDVDIADIRVLIDAYKDFRDNFYKEKQLKKQAVKVQNLLKVLKNIDEQEEADALKKVSEVEIKQPLTDEPFDATPDEIAQTMKKMFQPSGEIKPDKKELNNLQADARAFIRTLISSKEKVQELQTLINKGSRFVDG